MADEPQALQTVGAGARLPLVTHAVFVGLTPLVPVPFLDDVLKSYFRRRLVRSVAAAHGRVLSEEEVSALAEERGEGCLRGCVAQAVVYPLKKIFRKVFFFLEWKRAADLTSQTYHFGYLLDYALRRGEGGGPSVLDAQGAARVGWAVEAVCREAPIKPVERAVGGTFRQSKRALVAAAGLLGQSLRRLTRRTPAEEVARAIEEIEPREEQEVAPVVARLQGALAAVPEEHFRALRERLDARLNEGAGGRR